MSNSASRISVEIAGRSASLQEAVAEAAQSLHGLGDVLAKQTQQSQRLGESTVRSNRAVAASYAQTAKVAEVSQGSMLRSAAGTNAAAIRLKGYELAVQSAQNRVNELSRALAAGSGDQQKLNDALGLAQGRLSLAQGKLSAYSASTRAATTEIQKHKGAVQEAAYAMSGWSNRLGPLGRSLDLSARHAQLFREKGIDYLALGVLGLGAAFVGLSAKAAVSFEELTKEIAQQTGLSGNALEHLMSVIRVIARDSPYHLKEVADAAVVLRKQFHESDAQIETSANLMVAFAHATGQEVRPEMQQLSRILTDYRQPLSKVTDLTDKLVAVSQATQQPISGMANAVDKFGPKLQALGFNLNDSIRLLALFTASGVKADQMGRGLASAIGTASKAVQEGPAKLQQYGVAVQQAQLRVDTLNQKIRNGTGDQRLNAQQLDIAQQKLHDAKAKYDALNATLGVAKKAHGDVAAVVRAEMDQITHAHSRTEALNLAIEYFGKNLGPSMARALYHNEAALKKVDAAMGKTGATQGLFNVDQRSLNGQLERAKNNFRDMEIAVGNKLLPALSSVVGWMRGAIHDVEDFVKHNRTLVEVLGGVATSLAAITVLSRHTPLGFLTSKLPGPIGKILSPGGGSGIFGARGALAPGSVTNPIVVTMEGGRYSGLGSKSVDVAEEDAAKGGGAGAVSRFVGGFSAGIPEEGGGAAGAVGGIALPAITAAALPVAMAALAIFDRKDFPTGGNQGQPEWIHNTTQDIFGPGQVARNLRVFGGGNGADSGLGQFSKGGALGATGAGIPGETGIKGFLTQLATQGTKVKQFRDDLDRAGMALDNLAHHDVGVKATIGVLERLARQAKGLGDTKMQFADRLGAEMLKSKGAVSQGVQSLVSEVNKLPPALRQRAADGMIQMAHELQSKGQLSRQQMDNLLIYLDTHTKGQMQHVQTNVANAMTSVFHSVSTNTSKAKTAGAKNIGDLTTSVGHSLTSAAGTANTQTDHMHKDVASNTDKTHKDGAANIGALAKNIGGLLTGAAGATHTGIGNIGDQIAKALSSLGAGKFSIATVAAASNLASQAVAGVFGKAGGGYIGSPGEKGPDAVPIVVGRGEAVLNHAQQGVVNAALSAAGIGGLPQLFSQVTTPHYMARGGFAGGGVAGGGNALQGAGSQTAGYVYPVPGLAVERTDMGKDFGGAGPIGAIGPGVVVGGDWGWYPGEGSGLVYRLTAGPRAGMNVYVQEDIHPLVGMGAVLTPGEIIAQAWGGPHGIEMGWANASATGPLTPYNGAGDGTPMPGGIDFANFVLGLAHGQLVGSGLGGAVAIPQINLPEVKGGGVTGKMVTGGLKKIVDAANTYMQVHAAANAIAGAPGVSGSSGTPSKPGFKITGKASTFGPPGDPPGSTASGNPGGDTVPGLSLHVPGSSFGDAINRGLMGHTFRLDVLGRSGTFPDIDLGPADWTNTFIDITGAALESMGFDPSSWNNPEGTATLLYALGGFAAGGSATAHTPYVASTPKPSKPPKAASKSAKPKKPVHVKPPKLPALPKLKALAGFDQTLLGEITDTDGQVQRLQGWQGYLDSLHGAVALSTTVTDAAGAQHINWGDPGAAPGSLTGMIDPATGQQTKSIWDRLREIGAGADGKVPNPIPRDQMTELGVAAKILDQLHNEQFYAYVAGQELAPWLRAMRRAVGAGAKEIDWLGNAVDPTFPWHKLGPANFHSIDPAGNLVTTTGQIYQLTTDSKGKLHFQFMGNKMGPEIKHRAHELKNKVAQIEWATKLKEQLPLDKERRDAKLKARFDEAKHKIQRSSLTGGFSSAQLLGDQERLLSTEEKHLLGEIPTSVPKGWKGDHHAWSEEHKRERADISDEFAGRKAALRKSAADQKLAAQLSKSDALFALGKTYDAEKLAVSQKFGHRKNDLTDLIRNDHTIEGADKKWLGGWLSNITKQHTTETGALAAATDPGGFSDQLKAYNDPMGALAISVLTLDNVAIPNLQREVAGLLGTTLAAGTGAGTTDNSVLLSLQQQLNLQLSQALALNEAQTRALSSMIPEIPRYEQGGPVIADTLAYVHQGEHVVPKDGALVMRDPGGNAGPPIVIEHHWHGDAAGLRDLMRAEIAHPDNVRVVSKQVGRRTSMLTGAPGGFR